MCIDNWFLPINNGPCHTTASIAYGQQWAILPRDSHLFPCIFSYWLYQLMNWSSFFYSIHLLAHRSLCSVYRESRWGEDEKVSHFIFVDWHQEVVWGSVIKTNNYTAVALEMQRFSFSRESHSFSPHSTNDCRSNESTYEHLFRHFSSFVFICNTFFAYLNRMLAFPFESGLQNR